METRTTAHDASPPRYAKLFNEPQEQSVGQQSTVTVVTHERPIIYQPPPLVQSFAGHILLSCIVLWCCGIVCGVIAFILAVVAQNYSTSLSVHDRETARQFGKASMIVSVIGIIIGVIVTIVVVCLIVFGAAAAVAQCPYPVDGECYKHRAPMSYAECVLKLGHYTNGYCYYN